MSARSIPIALPSLGEEEHEALRGPLESGWLTQGPQVAAFERAFAERHSSGRALATTSCTTALQLGLAAAGIGPGDEVIVPAFTWVASANAVVYCGASPVFVDVDPVTYNLDPTKLRDVVTPRTRAVMPVHLFGLCADVDAVRAELPDGVFVLEDAACAAGATARGRSAGALGDAAAFSFHPRKIITTGEGGMLTTDDDELADRAEVLRNHGASVSEEARHAGAQPWLLPDFDVLGFNPRMTDLQAAVGLVQLGRLDGFLAERRSWAAWLDDRLAALPWLRPPAVPEGFGHSYQSYVTVVDPDLAPAPRNELMARLAAVGVSTRPGTHAVTGLGVHRDRVSAGACPVAARLEATTMAIPLHNRMDRDDFEYVVAQLLAL
jgi:perosamine synthetase